MRHLIVVHGDQLNHDSAVFSDFDPEHDAVWMAEVDEETTHVWCHKLRVAYFLSAMRHFRAECEDKGRTVHYHELTHRKSDDRGKSIGELLRKDAKKLKPEKILAVPAGDVRVREQVETAAEMLRIPLEYCQDRHFYCSAEEFAEYAKGRNSLRMEYFYREMRKRHNVLMTEEGEPEGEKWNYDHDNRESFGKAGPGDIKSPMSFSTDEITDDVNKMVEKRFSDHPGNLDHFTLPVTHKSAKQFFAYFVKHLLPDFGQWEDAMWTDEAFLYHSRLSAPLNLKLLSPRECVGAAVEAYKSGEAPLNSVEGFVRQILGWREFIRGVYWLKMPDYAEKNFLGHDADLPTFFWDGKTDMECVSQSMQHVLNHGYSHHIHRLMVLGNFSQLWGVHPYKFHEWHMAMYLDAIDWVSLPNTLGMSQFGDGGVVGTKPYCSSGNYINNMSNFCKNCRYNYKDRVGEDACPFTTLYWEFMDRHHEKLKDNPRMTFPMKNLNRIRENEDEIKAIRKRAKDLRKEWS